MIGGALPAWATDQTVPLVWFILALLTHPSRWSDIATKKMSELTGDSTTEATDDG